MRPVGFILSMLVINAHISWLVHVLSLLCCFVQFVMYNFVILFYQSCHFQFIVAIESTELFETSTRHWIIAIHKGSCIGMWSPIM